MHSRFFFLLLILFITFQPASSQVSAHDNLLFDSLSTRWDEGIPLGNGWLGALIWQKEKNIRVSLDRADLWDDRPMPKIDQLKFSWVAGQVKKQQYDTVQKIGDAPYDTYPAPTKIPSAALEFNCTSFGKVISNELDIKNAVSTITFQNGVVFNNYVHAINETGYFEFKKLPDQREGVNEDEFIPELMIPAYNFTRENNDDNSHAGEGLQTLGYKKGTIIKTAGSVRYHQPTWHGYYEVLVQWEKISPKNIVGCWTISINKKAVLPALNFVAKKSAAWASHVKWWKYFWNQSSVSLPDSMLEKQYYLELYKMGCVARNNTPPISLQAIWTADNGKLPPWKGDIHNDLNTELSYWPFFTTNHLKEATSFTNWLWKVKAQNKKWTKNYFEAEGLNVPGVTTISGKAMGGWIQYSMSPTTAAWLSQYFYWQWKYSGDKNFLISRAYTYLHEVATFLEDVSYLESGKRKLPLSSSPEFNDNDISAWFIHTTNYDLSLMKFAFKVAAEAAAAMHKKEEASHWQNLFNELPAFDVNETGLTIAPGFTRTESHRHHSNLMAIYPLGLLNINDQSDKLIINKSLRWLQKTGTDEWCGYSFSWAACLYARAKEGDNAAKELKIFSSNFCSPNSFHLNGDQKGGQYSKFTYRPFTLEGNFAFAQGINEMLLQSYSGIIEIFPAVPEAWKNISFNNLRAEGAFLISAKKNNGQTESVTIRAEAGGALHLKLPFKTFYVTDLKKKYGLKDEIIIIQLKKDEVVTIKNGYE